MIVLGRKIICESCGTVFREELLGNATICPVCGESLVDDAEQGWVTWWYLKDKRFDDDYTLWDKMPIDPDNYEIIKEFKAPPRNAEGKSTEAKKILKTYIPEAFEFPEPSIPQIRCPKCFSTEFQLVPKKFSILTGFATNKYDRVCNYCGKRW